MYTLIAFEKAAELKGLTGIELDIQLTKDNEIMGRFLKENR